ncbi:MAG: flippase [Bradyrhizobium sp.]|uniref:flippase n=1 Tax=Bradyrhizobium sp. TaxID=376 RepID=UPI0027309614|nr:flippase [Bradyrhizobium sp.]MDP1867810.1 flippase [Bradyrhizobium sp.]
MLKRPNWLGASILPDTRLLKNLLWSVLGTGLPMIVAVIAIPQLIAGIGLARFGILSLAWVVVGYFSFFDLGLSRAMTQLVAQKIGRGDVGEIPAIFWGGMTLMTLLGMLGAIMVWVISPWLVETKLAIPEALRPETLQAFYWLAASIPIVIATTGLRGLLEAYQRFDVINIVRIPLGLLTYLGPLAVLAFSTRLPDMVVALVVSRLVACVVYLSVCLKMYPALTQRPPLDAVPFREMLSYGGWMTVSNIIGPLIFYLGRLLLAVLVSADAVAYFSTPSDIVINLLTITAILTSVYFPMFAQQLTASPAHAGVLYRQATIYNIVAILPCCLLVGLFAKPALAWWINPEFADQSYTVAQLIALGVFLNSIGIVAQSLVQAFGRPDLTAKFQLLEIVLYVPYLWWLTKNFGIDGAAIAWVIRVLISAVVLWTLARMCLSGSIKQGVQTRNRSQESVKI